MARVFLLVDYMGFFFHIHGGQGDEKKLCLTGHFQSFFFNIFFFFDKTIKQVR